MLLAHPLPEHTGLGLLPVGLSLLGALAVVTVGAALPGRRSALPREGDADEAGQQRSARFRLRLWRSDTETESWAGRLSPLQVAARTFAVAILLLAIAAGRVGEDFQLDNIAPALVVGAAWPLLLLGSAVLGPVWRWLDPWDGVARLAQTDISEPEPRNHRRLLSGANVWPALLPGVAWAWYLGAYTGTLDPRPIGAALAAYSLFVVAGCVAFGRQLWLSRVEVFGLLFSWTARLPRGQLVSWAPPAGSEALIGALAGGFLFGRVRLTSLWGELNVVPLAALYAAAAVLVCSALGGAFFWFLERRSAKAGAIGAVAAASVPALVSLALAISMARNRLTTSLQLLPVLASDPLGFEWNLFGTTDWTLNPEPLGHVGLKVVQMIFLLVGHVIGAVVVARRVEQSKRAPALIALAAMFVPSVIAVAGTP